ncbi:MAG: Ig-like domain-containing protein [Myxococcales bacterium]|nr:Ig-like domain-containing protein [Myxococcales bacterium]
MSWLPAFAAAPKKSPARALDVVTTEETAAEGQLAAPRPGEKLVLTLKRWPKHGQATLDPMTGSFRYQPEKDFNGDDSFAVDLGTGAKASSVVVSVHVAAENDAPTATAASLTLQEDSTTTGRIEARDADGDILTFSLQTPPAHGKARVEPRTGAFTYRPNQDFTGADAFTIEVSDGAETVHADVAVTVTPVNDAPRAEVSTKACFEDAPCDGKALATDVDGDALTWRLVAQGKHGATTLDTLSGAFTFTPHANFHGDDAIVLEVSDGKLKVSTVVRLMVASVNDEPVVAAASVSADEDNPAAGRVMASDVDGDALNYRIGTPPEHGLASVDPRTGAFTYDGQKDFFGADTFTVEVGDGAATSSAPVQVTIAPVNDAPIATASSHTLDEDGRLEATCPATDVEGDPLTFQIGKKPKHGELTTDLSTGRYTYVPARDYQGPDSFTFEVSDGRLKSEAVVRLTIRPVNDAPVAMPLALSSNEDEAVYGAVAASDVDGQPLKYLLTEAPAHGTVKVDARTGALSYHPARDYHGADRFVVLASDGTLSSTSVVEVTLSPVDDPPTTRALRLETREDLSNEGALPGADVDGDALTFRLVGSATLGAVTLLDASTGTFRYTPRADLNGDDRIAFEVSDGRSTAKGMVDLRVAPVNDAPTLAGLTLETREDEQVAGFMKAADIDGDALTWSVVTQPTSGRAFVDPDGKVRFEPARDQNGQATFTVKVSDGALSSEPAQVVATIAAVNDAPVAAAATVSTVEDVEVSVTLRASDVDGDALAFSILRPPSHGELTLLDPARGTYLYSPAANWNGVDGFSFTVKDPAGLSSTADVKVVVAPGNDAPVAVGEELSVACNGQVTGLVKGFDRETKQVSFRLLAPPSQGRMRSFDARTGQFVLDMENVNEREVSFRFVASDGSLESAPAEVRVHTTCSGMARLVR